LKTRQWQGEDNQTKYTTEIHVNDFTFLSNKGESNSSMPSQATQQLPQTSVPQTPQASPVSSIVEEEDDLPF